MRKSIKEHLFHLRYHLICREKRLKQSEASDIDCRGKQLGFRFELNDLGGGIVDTVNLQQLMIELLYNQATTSSPQV